MEYHSTEQFASYCMENGIPAVPALCVDQFYVFSHEGGLFLVYPFREGKHLKQDEITFEHAKAIAVTFHQLHHLGYGQEQQKPKLHCNLYTNEHFLQLIEKFANKDLLLVKETLLQWNHYFRVIAKVAEKELVFSHSDMHPFNVLWDGEKPAIIDWESANWVNPIQELVGFSLEWCGIMFGSLNMERFQEMMRAYSFLGFRFTTSFSQGFYMWIGCSFLPWLEFNLQRVTSDSFDNEEAERGKKLLEEELIPALLCLIKNEQEILKNKRLL